MTDTQNDPHITDTEIYRHLTAAVAYVWDKILMSGQGTEYVKSVTFSTTPGTVEYPIATVVSAGDFYSISKLYVDEGSGQLRPIDRVNPAEIQAYRAPAQVVPMKLYYVPCAPVFTTGSESFDGINGFEELVLAKAAVEIKAKKEDDATSFERTIRREEDRIQTMAKRDVGEPPRVVKKRKSHSQDRYAPWRNNVSAYMQRGINIELYYRYGYDL